MAFSGQSFHINSKISTNIYLIDWHKDIRGSQTMNPDDFCGPPVFSSRTTTLVVLSEIFLTLLDSLIAMKLDMICYNFGDLHTFHLMPSSAPNFNLPNTFWTNYALCLQKKKQMVCDHINDIPIILSSTLVLNLRW